MTDHVYMNIRKRANGHFAARWLCACGAWLPKRSRGVLHIPLDLFIFIFSNLSEDSNQTLKKTIGFPSFSKYSNQKLKKTIGFPSFSKYSNQKLKKKIGFPSFSKYFNQTTKFCIEFSKFSKFFHGLGIYGWGASA